MRRAGFLSFASVLLLAALIVRAPRHRAPDPGTGAAEIDVVRTSALEWASLAEILAAFVESRAAWLESDEAALDEAELVGTCGNLASALDALAADLRRRGEDGPGFRDALRVRLRTSGGARRLFPAPAAPIRSFLLGAPGTPPGGGLELALERTLRALERLLEHLPPGSAAARALRAAIDAILSLLHGVDTDPVVVTFTAPEENAVVNGIPPIAFVAADGRSGVAPESRSLLASLPSLPPVDLTAFTAAETLDPDYLQVRVTASGIPDGALPDGFLTLTASATDRAGNPRGEATRRFVLDRQAPVIADPRPAPGSTVGDAVGPLSASWSDATSGVALPTARILLDGVDVSAACAVTDGGFAFVPPSLSAGSHSVSVAISDLAGNGSAVLTWSFTRALPPAAPVIVLPAAGDLLATPLPAVSGGSSTAGLTIELFVDGVAAGSTSSGAGGVWSLAPATALSDGLRVLTARASHEAGASALSSPVQVTVDTAPPSIFLPMPEPDSTTTSRSPTLSAAWSDATSGMKSESAVISLDGTDITASASVGDAGFSVVPPPLAEGPHTVTVRVSDVAGHSAVLSWSFRVEGLPPSDVVPPVVVDTVPPAGGLVGTLRPAFRATLADAGGAGLSPTGASLILNGVTFPLSPVFQDPDHATVEYTPGFDVPEGLQAATFEARDLAGNGVSFSFLFTIDDTPPSIGVLSPVAGATVGAAEVAFSARLEDVPAGLVPGSVRVLLDGTPQAVDALPGPAGPFGVPSRIDLSGVLPVQEGDRVLTVRVADLAGNTAESLVAFHVDAPAPPGDTLVLSVVSGSGQEGVVGRGVENDLVVRVTHASDGSPAAGVQIHFNGRSNAGVFGRSGSRSLITGAGGEAGARYVLSTTPGENVVTALISGSPDVPPVEFRAMGKLPSIDENFQLSTCNLMGGVTQEYGGSAIPRLIRARARKPDGSPLKGELVRPFVALHNGGPPAGPVGKFLPSRAMTNEQGEALFAFVIDLAAVPGPFTMRFGLPEFRDAQGKEVFFDLEGQVRDPANKRFYGSVEINYDDPARSGQSQVGVPGRPLSLDLRGRIVEGRNRPLRFVILEGAGTLSPGSEGTVWEPVVQPCGQVSLVMDTQESGNDGIASVRFTLAEGHTHALIAMEGWSDLWAVGPPETALVGASAGGGHVVLPNVVPTASDVPDPAAYYRVHARVPRGTVPSARLRSFNAFDQEPTSIAHAVAPVSMSSLAMSRDAGASRPEYDVFVSVPVASTDDLVPPETTPSGGGPVALLETTPFGGASATVTVLGQETGIKVRNTGFLKNAPDRRGLIFYKVEDPDAAGSAATLFRFSFALGDGRALKEARWDLDGDGEVDKTTPKAEIFATYGEAKNVAPAGERETPVALSVPETQANRRATFRLTVRVVYLDAEGNEKDDLVLPATLRLSLNAKVPQGATAAALSKSQTGLDDIANWNTTPPKNSSNVAIVFSDPANAPPGVKAAITDAGATPAQNRLSLGPTLGALGASFRNVDPAKLEVYGSAIGNRAFEYDLDVLRNTITHESKHLRSVSDAKAANTLFRVICQRIFTAFADPQAAAEVYMETYDHSSIELEDLLSERASYRHINDRNSQAKGGGPGGEIFFVLSFNAIEQALLEGKDFKMVSQTTQIRPTLWALPIQDPNLKTRLNAIYTHAIKKGNLPELELKDEFLQSGTLLRPPGN